MIYKMISVPEDRYLINLELAIYFVDQLLCKILIGLQNPYLLVAKSSIRIFLWDKREWVNI